MTTKTDDTGQIVNLTAERDAARAEVERMNASLSDLREAVTAADAHVGNLDLRGRILPAARRLLALPAPDQSAARTVCCDLLSRGYHRAGCPGDTEEPTP